MSVRSFENIDGQRAPSILRPRGNFPRAYLKQINAVNSGPVGAAKRNGCGGRGGRGTAGKRENEVGGKIKGSEFIFALIATELRNCLTSKIAPAQANYIHLLSLLAPVLL